MASKVKTVDTKKTKSFFQNATDTFKELFLAFAIVVVTGGALYALFEGKNLFEGFWWALVTAFTVGYGDMVPETLAARVVAVILMSISIFVIVPIITARMAARMIVNDDAWTDEEQQGLNNTLVRLNAFLDEQEAKKAPVKKTTARTKKK